MSQVLFECGPATNQGLQTSDAVQATTSGAAHTLSAAELLRLKDGLDGAMPFQPIATLALAYFDEVIEDFLGLEGEHRGKRYVALNPTRGDRNLGSFVISSESGQFIDFADPDECKGSDLIALTAYVRDCSQSVAANQLLDFLASLGAEAEYIGDQSSSGATTPTSSNPEAGVAAMRPITQILPAFDAQRFVRNGDAVEARYDYTDQSGQLCFAVLRIRKADGSKSFLPVSVATQADGGAAWTAKMPAGLRPLFGLPGLVGAEPSATVFVVEGEKAAQALQGMFPDSPVLTSAGGARAASKSDWSSLAGRDVVIWPDNDMAGQSYQQSVIRLIIAIDPATPISVVHAEALLRAVCGLKGWVYEEKTAEFKGWDAADAAALGLDPEVLTALIEDVIEPIQQEVPLPVSAEDQTVCSITGAAWSSGKRYRMHRDIVEVCKEKEGRSEWAKVCSRLEIVRQLRDSEGAGWSLELAVTAPDGTTKTIVVPRAWLTEPQLLKALLFDNGVHIHNWLEFQDYIGLAVPAETHELVRRVGWHAGAYVRSDIIYGDMEKPLALDGAAPACNSFGRQGTLDTWNSQIGRLCSGNTRLMLAVCTALAGPLLRPLGVENGGFHLVGPSSVGKTTALRVAASVYGPQDKFIRTWRSTSNGLESVAAGSNDCVLLIDEMNQATPQEAGEAVYMLGNGQGKARMTRTGVGARLHEWKLLFVSTGEIPLQQHMESVGKTIRAGMEVRLLNLPADAGSGNGMFETLHGFETSRALAEHLRAAAADDYGVAGDAWLRCLVDQMKHGGHEVFAERYRARLSAIEAQFARPGADGQVSRAARRFALLALAGEMAVDAGIGGWARGDATAAMQRCFEAWLTERGGVGSSEETQALRQVQRFFEQHGQARFQRIEPNTIGYEEAVNEVRTVAQRAGYFRPSTNEFYVLPEAFKHQVCEGLNSKLVARVLHERGLLLDERSRPIRIPGLISPTRIYRISGRIVGYDPDGASSSASVAPAQD